jgi:arabinofuranosyltransferase
MADLGLGRKVPRWVAWWNWAIVIAAGSVIGVLGYERRWIADDALIIVRTVREVLAGNGPVYSPGERAEASTSALWQWMLVLGSGVSGADAARIAVYGSLVLTVVGVMLAGASAVKFRRTLGATSTPFLPLGLVLLLALPPMWDFATSGLETGLEYTWIAASWWLVVTAGPARWLRRDVAFAVVVGLGPLVRPEQTVTAACFFVAYLVRIKASRKRGIGLAVCAAVLDLGYMLFRMGYYGLLVPLPALAKEASLGDPQRGWNYVKDFLDFYWLWAPLALMVGVLLAVGRRLQMRDAVVFAAPPVAGLLLTAYVIRVGGDYMHARMMLPAVFLLLLPIAMVPFSKPSAVTATITAGTAALILSPLRVPFEHGSFNGTTNIRGDSIFSSPTTRTRSRGRTGCAASPPSPHAPLIPAAL